MWFRNELSSLAEVSPVFREWAKYLILFVNDTVVSGLSETSNIAVLGYRDKILLQRIITLYRVPCAGYTKIYISVVNQQVHISNIF